VASVQRIQLADDLSVARVTTGLWQLADMEREGGPLDAEATAAAMEPYLAAGLTTFDMADHYGSAELVAGRLVARRGGRGGIELLTKWVPEPGPASRDLVRAAVHRALSRLGVRRIDLLQFHAWRYSDPSWLDCLGWLDEIRRQGEIHHLGLTNFDAAHLGMVCATGIRVVSNQVCFSLLDRRPAGALTAVCATQGVKLLAYGTVAGGFLTEKWLGAAEPDWDELPTWSEMKYGRFIRAAGGWEAFQRVLAAAGRIATRHGVSIANVAARAILEHPAVAAVIIGARLGSRSHLDDNLGLFRFALDPADRRELEEALATLTPIPGDSGDEYRKPPYLTASGDLSHHVAGDTAPPLPSRPGTGDRVHVSSGTPWESIAGFARAVRVDNRILVSGTTATHGDRLIGGNDPAAQTHFILDKIAGAIESLGGTLEQVVRTRVYLKRLADWEAVARAHGERFGAILPANTMVRADLIGEEYLVEIEAEAHLPSA
jgi:aryl-alcohol dehydrogenase-like predicted oxidoreductase/enamine deaminase RidA (YjgF/YER057c/UK114 family)